MTYCIGKLCTVSTKGFYENLKVYEIVQAKATSIETNDLDGQGFLFKWLCCPFWVRLSVADSHAQKDLL